LAVKPWQGLPSARMISSAGKLRDLKPISLHK
jgi:hypothetical protein